MDIKPFIVGPDLSISPDLVVIPLEDIYLPLPGIVVSSRKIVFVVGENCDAALDFNLCCNLRMEGKTGKHNSTLSCIFEKEGQYHIKGTFGGVFADYFLTPIPNGVMLKGKLDQHLAEIRINTSPTFSKFVGIIDRTPIDITFQNLTKSIIGVSGTSMGGKADMKIKYSDEGIAIDGENQGVKVAYSLKSLGDKIEMKGFTKDLFASLSISMKSGNLVHVTGKSRKVPVDYELGLYENGMTISGNTGYYKADWGFVTEESKDECECQAIAREIQEAETTPMEEAEEKFTRKREAGVCPGASAELQAEIEAEIKAEAVAKENSAPMEPANAE